MRKHGKWIMTAVIVLCAAFGGTAMASQALHVTFKGEHQEVGEIKLIDGKSYVPVRDFAEHFGMDVEYDGEKGQVSVNPVDFDVLPQGLNEYLTAWKVLDADLAANSFVDDGFFHDGPTDQIYRGKAAMQQYFEAAFKDIATIPGYRMQPLYVTQLSGDHWIGTWQMYMGDMIVSEGISYYTIRDGKMVDSTVLEIK